MTALDRDGDAHTEESDHRNCSNVNRSVAGFFGLYGLFLNGLDEHDLIEAEGAKSVRGVQTHRGHEGNSSEFAVNSDGVLNRKYDIESNVNKFTSLDTVRVLLDVLDELTLRISTINS